MLANPQFASTQQFFRKENGGTDECVVLLQNVIPIGIQ
jgi:hypothetical protein